MPLSCKSESQTASNSAQLPTHQINPEEDIDEELIIDSNQPDSTTHNKNLTQAAEPKQSAQELDNVTILSQHQAKNGDPYGENIMPQISKKISQKGLPDALKTKIREAVKDAVVAEIEMEIEKALEEVLAAYTVEEVENIVKNKDIVKSEAQ